MSDQTSPYLIFIVIFTLGKTIIKLIRIGTKNIDIYKAVLGSFIYIILVYRANERLIETIPLILQEISTKLTLSKDILNVGTIFIADLVSDRIFKSKIIKLPQKKDVRIFAEYFYRLFVVPGVLIVIELILIWIFIVWSLIQIYLLSPH